MSSVLWSNDNEHVKHIWNVTWRNDCSLADSLHLNPKAFFDSMSERANCALFRCRRSLIFNKVEERKYQKHFFTLHFVVSYSVLLLLLTDCHRLECKSPRSLRWMPNSTNLKIIFRSPFRLKSLRVANEIHQKANNNSSSSSMLMT